MFHLSSKRIAKVIVGARTGNLAEIFATRLSPPSRQSSNSPSMDRFKSISKSGWHPGSSPSPSYNGASESRSSSSGGGGVTSRLTKNFKSLDHVVCPFFCLFLFFVL